MIFVDTNVFMYAVGRAHPLRADAQGFFETAAEGATPLATSAEVLQELLHVYIPVGRLSALDAALMLAHSLTMVWPLEPDDVTLARTLVTQHPGLGARDLIHLAVCRRHRVRDLQSYDRSLLAAFRT